MYPASRVSFDLEVRKRLCSQGNKYGERDLVDTVFLVIFPLVSLMKDQVSVLSEKGVKAVVLGPETSNESAGSSIHSETKSNRLGVRPHVRCVTTRPRVLNSDILKRIYFFSVYLP